MKISLTSLLSTAVTIVSVTGEEKQYIIKYKDVVDVGADMNDMLAVETGIAAISTATEVHHVLVPQNAIAGTYSDKAIEKLRNDPNIEYIEDDIIASIAVDDDTDYYSPSYLRSSNNGSGGGGGDRRLQGSQTIPYGIPLVQADQVDNRACGFFCNRCVKKICVVDSGYDKGHVDLPSGNDVTGSSTVGSGFPYDGNLLSSHGTHVAGTVAALDNEIGVVGVLNGSPLHNVRVFRQGSGSIANVVAGFNDCVAVGANVINMSLGSSGNSPTFRNAVRQAYDQGILLVAAAGNQGSTNFFYPASYNEVISVTGVDENEKHFGRSNRNSQSEIAAPAVRVNSTINDNRYALRTGTSMASPHVAGAAAVIWSYYPLCRNDEIRDALQKTAKDLGEDGKDPLFGFGLLQVKDALDYLRFTKPCDNSEPCITTSPPVSVPPTPPPVTTPPITSQPTNVPTGNPTRVPTGVPTSQPTGPTNPPTSNPTGVPTNQPTNSPTRAPVPTNQPTNSPTRAPVPTQSSRVIAVNDVFDIGCFFYPDRPWLAECSIKSTNEEASAGKGVPVMDNDSASPVRRPLRIDLVTSTQDDDNIHGLCTIAGDRQTVVYTPGRNRAKATKICTYQVCTDDDGPERCDTAQVTINMEEFTVIEV